MDRLTLQSRLFRSALRDDVPLMKEALSCGADVHFRGANGLNALSVAVLSGSFDVAAELAKCPQTTILELANALDFLVVYRDKSPFQQKKKEYQAKSFFYKAMDALLGWEGIKTYENAAIDSKNTLLMHWHLRNLIEEKQRQR